MKGRTPLPFFLLFVFATLGKDAHLLTAADRGHLQAHVGHLQNESSQAPDFTVTDFNGQKITLSQYRGKVVLLDFWASWCAPCQAEIPRFIEWQKKYGEEGLQVIGISMDDNEKAARKFVERLKPNYPIAMGNAKLAESYGGILGLPANLIINRAGRLRSKYVGATDLDALEREIQVQLALQ